MPESPLPYGRQKVWRRQPLGDVLVQAQPMQAGPGQDHGIELSLEGLVQPGLNVAPDRGHLDIGTQVQQLGTPAQRTGADLRPRREGLQGLMDRGDQGIGNILAHGYGGQNQFVGTLGGQVLEAVHGDVDRSVKDRALDLLGEQPRPTDGSQWRVAVAVSLGADLDELHIQTGMIAAQAVRNPFGLPARQAAAASANPQGQRFDRCATHTGNSGQQTMRSS